MRVWLVKANACWLFAFKVMLRFSKRGLEEPFRFQMKNSCIKRELVIYNSLYTVISQTKARIFLEILALTLNSLFESESVPSGTRFDLTIFCLKAKVPLRALALIWRILFESESAPSDAHFALKFYRFHSQI